MTPTVLCRVAARSRIWLPEDASARAGELLLLIPAQVAMDLGEAIERALQACLNATEGDA